MVDSVTNELVRPDGMPPLQWEWWREWWAQDYSWNSERFRPYRELISNVYNSSGNLAPLESHLRTNGHLIESPEGILFHICWLPPYWRDGTPTEFYQNPQSVRNKAEDAFVNYFRTHEGEYAGLTSTLGLMSAAASTSFPLSRGERCFLGGPFIRTSLARHYPVELRHCLIAFGQEDQESHQLVGWNVRLYRSTFSTQSSTSPANAFKYVRFVREINLSDCDIEEDIWFYNCTFEGVVYLGEGESSNFSRKFDGRLYFVNCTFQKIVNANQESHYGALHFHRCIFNDNFGASKLRVHQYVPNILSFSGSIFNKEVLIGSENLVEVAPAFANSNLNAGIDFGPFESVLDEKFFMKLRLDVLAHLGLASIHDAKSEGKLANVIDQEDIELRRMISGMRVIRLASQSGGDKLSESHLHAIELAAYERLSTTNSVSKFFASAYRMLSDYGCSLSKPVIWWFGTLLMAGFLYAFLNEWAQQHSFSGRLDLGEIWEGVLYSFSRVIPVGPWQELVFADSILSTGKGTQTTASSWQKVAVVIIASLQSLFSAILLFLFGLAARRKFQVG